MFFRSILLTAAFGLAPTVFPAATYAADTPATRPAATRPHPLERVKHVLEQLNLTEDQKAKVKVILEAAHDKIKPILETGDKEKIHAEVPPIIQDTFKQIHELLTDEQKAKLKELREAHRDRAGSRPAAK